MRGQPESAERHGAGHVARCTVERLMADLALDVLEMAFWQRKRTGADLTGLVQHLRPWGAV